MNRDLVRVLRGIVGEANVSASPSDTAVYSYDASLAVQTPGAVVFPADTGQVSAVVGAASAAGVPFVPRGFGTNLSGGSISPESGLVVCLSRMNRILALNPRRRTAVVQPGVTNLELQQALAGLGYFFAPDPASQKVATLGGNVGENSGGPRCVKYGVTKNHVLGLECVLPDGSVARFGGETFECNGYDLGGVVVGSEGTLCVVTEITGKVLPLPESVLTLLVLYDDIADAARSVSRIIADGIQPSALEMMDAPVMRAVEESRPCGYPLDAAAVLIIEVEGPELGLQAQAERIRSICREQGCRSIREAADAAERDQLWAGRRGAFGAVARLAPNYLVADCSVPRSKLPLALARVAEIAGRNGLEHGNVFHAGDGNLHPLLLFDSRDPDQLNRVRRAGWEIMRACVDLGGTISGEHGVGVEKLEAMRLVFSEPELEVQHRVRAVFNPRDLLNPGKVLPEPVESRQGCQAAPEPIDPDAVLRPATAAEVCRLVRSAYLGSLPLQPCGSGRMADFGNSAARPAALLSSRELDRILELEPADQTVVVQPGCTLARLQEQLGSHGQWLPVRPELREDNTLGGMAALNSGGPERLRYGSLRDYVLGLQWVDGQGRLLSTGGRVMKNVAGFDLTRLLLGSCGTLGFVAELTLKVAARPDACLALVGSGSPDQVDSAAARLLDSRLEPAFLLGRCRRESLNGDSDRACLLAAGFEGFRENVEHQVSRARKAFAAGGLAIAGTRTYSCLRGARDVLPPAPEDATYVIRCDVPLDSLLELARGTAGTVLEGEFALDFGCGRLRCHTPVLAHSDWQELVSLADRLCGHPLLEVAPEQYKRSLDVFGSHRPEWDLAARLKQGLDPGGIFAPGRAPGKNAIRGASHGHSRLV